MEVFQKVYRPNGQDGALGAFDAEVEKSWAAAVAAGARHPYFATSANQTSQYYSAQGYSLKAESILRLAISAAKQVEGAAGNPANPTASRDLSQALSLSLASRLSQDQKLLAAAEVLQELLRESKVAPNANLASPNVGARISALTQLAYLREQMGEVEAAEALYLEAGKLQALPKPSVDAEAGGGAGQRSTRISYPGVMASLRGGQFAFARSFAGRFPGANDLVGFYQRQGDIAKAEALLQKEVDEAKTSDENLRARQNYASFLGGQQRWTESVAQWQQLVEMNNLGTQPESGQMRGSLRVNLAQALLMAGKSDEALGLLRDYVTQSNADARQRMDALRLYANMLMQQNKFEEAEKIVEQVRNPTGANSAEVSKYAGMMADNLLADIRQRQNRGEEAAALREKASVESSSAKPETVANSVPLWNRVRVIHELLSRQKFDDALAQLQPILAESQDRLQSNPEEFGAFVNIVRALPRGRQEERQQLIRSLTSTLEGMRPADHPRLAHGIGMFLGGDLQELLGAAETNRLLEKEEKILVASKGADSPALNEVSRHKARYFSSRGDHTEAASELKRALKRTELATGERSQQTIQVLRDLTNSLQMNNENWPEEEGFRLALIERSAGFRNMGPTLVHDMSMFASRYYVVGQVENAVSWMDKAIELARKSPQTAAQVQQLEAQRKNYASNPGQAPAGASPFFGRSPSGVVPSGEYSSTIGVRLGAVPPVPAPPSPATPPPFL